MNHMHASRWHLSFFSRFISDASLMRKGQIKRARVTIVTYLAIFQPTILFSTKPASEKPIYFDIFSSILFIVAGPALGITLSQLHRGILAMVSKIHARTQKRGAEDEKFLEDYAKVRLKMKTEEKLELDIVEAFYDFCVSTGMAVLILAAYGFYELHLSKPELLILPAVGLILLFEGYVIWEESYSPMWDNLKKEYLKSA